MSILGFLTAYFLTGLAAAMVSDYSGAPARWCGIIGYAFGGFTTLFIAVLFGTKDCFL